MKPYLRFLAFLAPLALLALVLHAGPFAGGGGPFPIPFPTNWPGTAGQALLSAGNGITYLGTVAVAGAATPFTNAIVGYGGDPATAAQTNWFAEANGGWYETNKTGNVVWVSNGVVTASVQFTGNGVGLTNVTSQYSTNPIPALAIGWQKAYFTNIAANFTITLNAPANNYFETSVIMVTNSSSTDFKVTMPAGVWGPFGAGTPAIAWCSNQLVTEIDLKHYGQLMTNMTVTHYAP